MDCIGLPITLRDGRTILVLAGNEAELIDTILDLLDSDLVHDFTCQTNPGWPRYREGFPCDCSVSRRVN